MSKERLIELVAQMLIVAGRIDAKTERSANQLQFFSNGLAHDVEDVAIRMLNAIDEPREFALVRVFASVGRSLQPIPLRDPSNQMSEDVQEIAASFAEAMRQAREMAEERFGGASESSWLHKVIGDVVKDHFPRDRDPIAVIDEAIRHVYPSEVDVPKLGPEDLKDALYALERVEVCRRLLARILTMNFDPLDEGSGCHAADRVKARQEVLAQLIRMICDRNSTPLEKRHQVMEAFGGVVGLLIGAGIVADWEQNDEAAKNLAESYDDSQEKALTTYLSAVTNPSRLPISSIPFESFPDGLDERDGQALRDSGFDRAWAFEIHFSMVIGRWFDARGTRLDEALCGAIAAGYRLHQNPFTPRPFADVELAMVAIDRPTLAEFAWPLGLHLLSLSTRFLVESASDPEFDDTSLCHRFLYMLAEQAEVEGNLEVAEAAWASYVLYVALHAGSDEVITDALEALARYVGSHRGFASGALDYLDELSKKQAADAVPVAWVEKVESLKQDLAKTHKASRKKNADVLRTSGQQIISARVGEAMLRMDHHLRDALIDAGIKLFLIRPRDVAWKAENYAGTVMDFATALERHIQALLGRPKVAAFLGADRAGRMGLGEFEQRLRNALGDEDSERGIRKIFPACQEVDALFAQIERCRLIRNAAAHGEVIDRQTLEEFLDALLGPFGSRSDAAGLLPKILC